MIIGDVDLEVIELFSRDLARFYSINEIARLLRKRYPYVNKRVNLLIKEGVISKRNLGASHLCYLNLADGKSLALLMLVWVDKQKKLALQTDASALTGESSCVLYEKGRLIAVSENISEKNSKPAAQGVAQIDEQMLLTHLKEEGVKGIVPLQGYERYLEYVRSVEKELRIGGLNL